jgi:hypothetical protein
VAAFPVELLFPGSVFAFQGEGRGWTVPLANLVLC